MSSLTPERLGELRAYAQTGIHAPSWEVLALIDEVERLRELVEEHEEATKAPTLLAEAGDAAQAALDRVREAVSNHPDPCGEHPEDDAVSCGWRSAYRDVVAALRDGDQR